MHGCGWDSRRVVQPERAQQRTGCQRRLALRARRRWRGRCAPVEVQSDQFPPCFSCAERRVDAKMTNEPPTRGTLRSYIPD